MTPADIIVMRILLFGILVLLFLVLPFNYGLNLYERYKETDEYIEKNAKKILAQQQLDSVRRVREARLEYVIENGGCTPYKNDLRARCSCCYRVDDR